MSETALAAEEIKRFLQNLHHIEAACDQLRTIENLGNEVTRLTRERDTLIANIRSQAERECNLNLEAREAEFEARCKKREDALNGWIEMSQNDLDRSKREQEGKFALREAELTAKLKLLEASRAALKEELR